MLNKTKTENILNRFTAKRRARYLTKKRQRLANTTPTIIGNDCVSGMMYHDLGLRFNSPTVDVLIYMYDFFPFVEHLEHYMTCVPEETTLENISYPLGVIKCGEEQIILHFMHDKSFEEAKEKWLRRCARVDFDNLYIVFQQVLPRNKLLLRKSHSWYQRFKAIKYPNKRMLVNTWISFDKEIVPMARLPFFKVKSLLQYPTKYSKKRAMDRFDYVSFLNQNNSKKEV